MRSTHGEHTNPTLAHGGTITRAAVRYWPSAAHLRWRTNGTGRQSRPVPQCITRYAAHESAWNPNAGSLYAWPAWIRGSSLEGAAFEGAAFEGAAYCVGRW